MSNRPPGKGDLLPFLGLVWESTKGLPTVLGIGAIIGFAISPDWQVEVRWVLPAGILAAAVVVALVEAAWKSFLNRDPGLPPVVSSCEPPPGYDPSPLLCLLGPSELYSQGDSVSLYYRDENELEILFGFGFVLNIQIDKKIQVILTDTFGGPDRILERLARNEEDARARVLVKPSVPQVRASDVDGDEEQ